MADSTLVAVRTKIRRLTRSPSVNQLTDAQIDEYVNTFIQYDFPEHLRLSKLRRTLTWYTDPFIDTYATNAIVGDPLNNFENVNLTVHPPIYVAGFEAFFSQSRERFFRTYPFTNSIASIGVTGDGVTVAFARTLASIPVLRNNVVFSAIDANNNGLRLSDDGAGNLVGDGNGAINYVTGVYNLNFNVAPAVGSAINSETVPYVAARPMAILYFDNSFVVRPIPDQVYPVRMDVYVRPTELLAANQSPELEEWWSYIAYGAAKKVFEDRMDMDSVQMIMPEFKTQELLVLRRSIVQQTSERVSTIYTEQSGLNGFGWYPGGFN